VVHSSREMSPEITHECLPATRRVHWRRKWSTRGVLDCMSSVRSIFVVYGELAAQVDDHELLW
jgi:hypothetical protein